MSEPARSPAGQLIARVNSVSDLPATLDALAVRRGRPVLVLIGGAGRMSDDHLSRTADVVGRQVVPVVHRVGAAVVDGGTDSGVMRMMGQARSATGASFPLVGVAAQGTVSAYPAATRAKAAKIEPCHSHVILVPGDSWGDESPWLASVADVLAGTGPSATLVVNGGEITYRDIARSLERRRPVVVLAGTGRTADSIATAVDHGGKDLRARQIARSPLTRIVSIDDGPALARTLESILGQSPRILRASGNGQADGSCRSGRRDCLLADLDGPAYATGRDPIEHIRVQEIPERAHY
jgi:TRPM family ion channel